MMFADLNGSSIDPIVLPFGIPIYWANGELAGQVRSDHSGGSVRDWMLLPHSIQYST
jgi:hypothetical protein